MAVLARDIGSDDLDPARKRTDTGEEVLHDLARGEIASRLLGLGLDIDFEVGNGELRLACPHELGAHLCIEMKHREHGLFPSREGVEERLKEGMHGAHRVTSTSLKGAAST